MMLLALQSCAKLQPMNTKAELFPSLRRSERVDNALPVYIQVGSEYVPLPSMNASGIIGENYIYVRLKPRTNEDGAYEDVFTMEDGKLQPIPGRLSLEKVSRELAPPPAWIEDAEAELKRLADEAERKRKEIEDKARAAGFTVVGSKLVPATSTGTTTRKNAARAPKGSPKSGKFKPEDVGKYILVATTNEVHEIKSVDNGFAVLDNGVRVTLPNKWNKFTDKPKSKSK